MPYSAANACCSSILTLPILARPSNSSASSSSTGAIILHGPHHSAQKSTSTGAADWRTCSAKFSCVRFRIKGEAIAQNNGVRAAKALESVPLLGGLSRWQKPNQVSHAAHCQQAHDGCCE